VSLIVPRPADESEPLLTVRGLTVSYGNQQVVHGVDMDVHGGECVALVGGSGSGKTTISRSIVGLTARRSGDVRFQGELLRQTARARPRELRRAIQYIFQSPYGSLNPRKTIGESVSLPLKYFFGIRGRELRSRVVAALEQVVLPRAKADQYPDQLSGGERQRAAIARALVCKPRILICDEITSALDVSVQAAIVELLDELRRDEGVSLIFVTHNLALVRSVADRVVVLDQGRVVESGAADVVLTDPAASYTKALLGDAPSLDRIRVGDDESMTSVTHERGRALDGDRPNGTRGRAD
jgi:peptide/nickel transport system ATP-binding protein